METSSVNSISFNFRGFKVDKISLDMKPQVQVLELSDYSNYQWDINISIRHVTYIIEHKIYIAGIDCNLKLYSTNSQKNQDDVLAQLNIGCAGSFGVNSNRFEAEVESRIVKLQFTALLFSQIRGTISSILANAGYGSVLLPLINIQQMFESKLDAIQINSV